MIRVAIIGSGNVAQHLIKAVTKTSEVELVQVFSRKKETLTHLISINKIITDLNRLTAVDLVIIAVSDDAIAEVSKSIILKNQLVAHTSGTIHIDAIDDTHRKGVFYPLQTFSKSKEVDFTIVPICLEATNGEDYNILEKVANAISKSVYCINSEQRKALHVAAVFVSNFANHLYKIGNDICTENNLPFSILKPLIQETADKILTLSPSEAQTGPAQRQDTLTINKHLGFLTNESQKEIYTILTKSIIDNGKKL